MKLREFFLYMMILFFIGCAATNQALTPSVKTVVSDFDGSIEVFQKPVSAASGMKDSWNMLGFRWTSKEPNYVFLIVGLKGIVNISSVSFNIDGNIVRLDETARKFTDCNECKNRKSTRQFSMLLSQFRVLASAKIVKMKIESKDTYYVSSFGQSKRATVGGKFAPFLQQVDAQLAKK